MGKRIVIIGGVAGGASCACRLRRLSEDYEIILIEKGEYVSFANCGLPYYIGEVITDKSKLIVQTPKRMKERFNLDVRTSCEAVDIDKESKTVKVKNAVDGHEEIISYDTLVLSPGAKPFVPQFDGSNAKNIFTLRNIPDTYRIYDFIAAKAPNEAIVVGGGFIGIEMAENLIARGIKVHLVELADHVVGSIDLDMAHIVHAHIKEKGIDLKLGVSIKKITENGDTMETELSDGTSLNVDMVVMSIGVRPETELAKNAGLKIGVTGGIWTDDYMQTSDKNIYAVGDAVEVTNFLLKNPALIPLAGPANKQGRIAANNIHGIKEKYRGSQGTSVLKVFDLTVASTGCTEKQLKQNNIEYHIIHTHPDSHAGYYPGGTMLSLKIIFDHAGKILGATAIGKNGADKRIDVIATAMHAGIKADELQQLELAYAPPFSSAKDPVNMAGYIAENMLAERTHMFYCGDIANIDTKKDILLDVRTEYEFDHGCIPGAINIPLDSLRERIAELPKDKDIYIYCRSGLRGYIAERILALNGFTGKLSNLSGGYLSYEFMANDK
jgi:NADPH-dependent 2,4-dienoyl-CoA reductase/sulfur reductase-like enzyme/rhodanese-related sulfurtransferase